MLRTRVGLEFLRDATESLAIERSEPAVLRNHLLAALAKLGIQLPGAESMNAEELARGDDHTLLAFVDDSAGQLALVIYRDRDLGTVVLDAIDRVNGLCAAGPMDLERGAQLHAVVRVLGLLGVYPSLEDWLEGDEDEDAPTAAQMAELATNAPVASVVLDSDRTPWKHGPKPPPDFLRRRFSRVASFNLAM